MGYRAVRTERWKYIHYGELEGMDELYDLKADPYEMKNLIKEPGAQDALKEMKAELALSVKRRGGSGETLTFRDDGSRGTNPLLAPDTPRAIGSQ
jgi:arylsulfatase A-like enzyme